MASIHLTHFMAAPADVVFDLYRHIGLHKSSQQQYKEEAIRGATTGLMKKGDLITWRAKHLRKIRFLTIKITQLEIPVYLENTMLEGDFKSFVHKLYFKKVDNGTIIIDELEYETPYGIAGKLLNHFYLNQYLTRLLQERADFIRSYAESNKWKALLQR